MKNKEFEAWITSNGIILPELCVETKDRTVHCFIPCEVGKLFQVHWRDHGSKKFTSGYIYVDGYACPGRYLQGSGETFRAGARSGPVSERPFVFAPIVVQASESSPGPNMEVGSIVLKIAEVHRGPGRPANKLENLHFTKATSADSPKTGGVCLNFGDPQIVAPLQAPFTWSSTPANPNWNHSYVKFEFKYRTHTWLQQQGMIPLDAPGMRTASIPAPIPEMGATVQAFAVQPEGLEPHARTGAVVLPTTRVGDVASGTPARVPSNKFPREVDGTVTMVRNPSAKLTDKGKGKAPAPVPTPRMPDAGDLATLAPPSSRPPIFAPTGSNLFIRPPRAGQQRRVVSSGSSQGMPVGSSTLPAMTTLVIPKSSGPSRSGSLPPRALDFSLGPGIGAPSGAMPANVRRPLGSRNVSNTSIQSTDSMGSMGSMTSVPSTVTNEPDDLFDEYIDMDQSQ